MNSGISPEILSKDQLSFALNCSVRLGYIHPRSSYQKKTLNFGNNGSLQELYYSGFFQGGGYYRPDFGPASLIAQISGRLLLFTEVGTQWTVTEITIPGDPNSATATQCWMWQSEKWMIIQDGTGSLPIFYDGTTSRRSYGATKLLGTTASDFTPPAIGASTTVTLAQPWTGPYNIPVILNGEYYEPVQQATGYSALLQNLNGTQGTDVPVGTSLIVQPSTVGELTGNTQSFGGTGALSCFGNIGSTAGLPTSIFNAIQVTVSGLVIQNGGTNTPVSGTVSLYAQGPTQVFIQLNYGATGNLFAPAGSIITTANSSPNTIIGTTVTDFITPAVGSQIAVSLSSPYIGPANQVVYLNGAAFAISNPTPAPPGTNLILVNLTDTSTNSVVHPKTIMSLPELPAGRMGAYGMGCNAVTLTDGLSYIIGDVVGAASGTPALNYRDAVLRVTENTFLAGGGNFRVPNTGDTITSAVFPPQLDTSLGQGALMIGTPDSIWSNAGPGTDPSTWETLTFPIVTESLKDKGTLGQWSTFLVNSDTYFRSTDGISSLVIAQRQFYDWGNKPISNEMIRVLDADDQTLLNYSSGISFDNRAIVTASPQSTAYGVVHQGTVDLNFDLISTVRTKAPPAWDGLWTGLNIFQLIKGKVNGNKRAFAFTYNFNTFQGELYEFLAERNTLVGDNGTTPIFWAFETAVMFGPTIKNEEEFIELRDGHMALDQIQGNVEISVFYRPDNYPCWVKWTSFSICATLAQSNGQQGYRTRIGFGEPSVLETEESNNQPLRNGYFFQLRVEIKGQCRVKALRAMANAVTQPVFAKVQQEDSECQDIQCELPDDISLYLLQGNPVPASLPANVTPSANFSNNQVFYGTPCPSNQDPIIAVTLPTWISYDTVNHRFVGAANIFDGATQAAADATASNALNSFVNTNINEGFIFCQSTAPASCGGTDRRSFKIQGYADGQIAGAGFPGGSRPVFDGTFQFQQTGSLCNWGWSDSQQGQIDGSWMTCANLLFNGTAWELVIYCFGGAAGFQVYGAQKLTGSDASGVYTTTMGTGPSTIVIIPMNSTTTIGSLASCT